MSVKFLATSLIAATMTLSAAADRAAVLAVGTDADDPKQHVLQVARDGDLADGVLDAPVTHQVTRGTVRVIAGDAVHTMPHQFGDQ